MNKIIQEQLKNCKVANIPEFTKDTTTLLIPLGMKNNQSEIELSENNYYLIEVEDYIIKPYAGFTLHDNWNNGIIPKDKEMKISVVQVMGKMVKVDSVGNLTGLPWTGWLPKKAIKIISKL